MGRAASNILDLRDTDTGGDLETYTGDDPEEGTEAAGTHDVGDNTILADMIKTACADMEVIDTERD